MSCSVLLLDARAAVGTALQRPGLAGSARVASRPTLLGGLVSRTRAYGLLLGGACVGYRTTFLDAYRPTHDVDEPISSRYTPDPGPPLVLVGALGSDPMPILPIHRLFVDASRGRKGEPAMLLSRIAACMCLNANFGASTGPLDASLMGGGNTSGEGMRLVCTISASKLCCNASCAVRGESGAACSAVAGAACATRCTSGLVTTR